MASLFSIRVFFRIWEEFLAIAHSPALGEFSLDPEVWLKMCDVYPQSVLAGSLGVPLLPLGVCFLASQPWVCSSQFFPSAAGLRDRGCPMELGAQSASWLTGLRWCSTREPPPEWLPDPFTSVTQGPHRPQPNSQKGARVAASDWRPRIQRSTTRQEVISHLLISHLCLSPSCVDKKSRIHSYDVTCAYI